MAHPGGSGRTARDGGPASSTPAPAPTVTRILGPHPQMPFLRPGQRPLPAGFRLPPACRLRSALTRPAVEPEPLPSLYAVSESLRRENLAARRTTIPQRVDGTSLSFLEQTAVKTATSRDYRLRVMSFCKWCLDHNLSWRSAEELDAVLTMHFDELFFRGEPADHGSKLLAALKHFESRLSRLGALGLPRAGRALGSWVKAAPSLQRLPFPWIALCAVLGFLVERGRLASALHLLVAFRSYLRPGASDQLRVKQLVPPQPMAGQAYQAWGLLLNPTEDRTPGKTGLLDEAILLDSEPWLHPFFVALTVRRDPEEFLWPVRGAELVEEFLLACTSLGLSHLRPCRYALRHGGASDDLLTRRREHLAVKRRGGWATDASLKRYGKETRLLKEIGRIPPAVLAYGSLASANLPGVLHRTFLLPPAPRPGLPDPAPLAPPARGRKRARQLESCPIRK